MNSKKEKIIENSLVFGCHSYVEYFCAKDSSLDLIYERNDEQDFSNQKVKIPLKHQNIYTTLVWLLQVKYSSADFPKYSLSRVAILAKFFFWIWNKIRLLFTKGDFSFSFHASKYYFFRAQVCVGSY